MPISNKSTVFAIMKEATEGTVTVPAAATDFIPIQSDLSMVPEVEKLDNEEMKNSLGMAKKITGSENPTASFSHYIKSSGVVGQAPAWGKLLESLFGGVKVAATEYPTVAGSTTAAVKVADASVFRVGEPLLIKDGVNGYSIGFVHSIDTVTDLLTLGFQLANAPAAAVNLGKAVTYYPVNTATHPSLTLWRYQGNGGAKDMIRGAKVTELSFNAEAGQLINGSISLEGLEYFFNQIQITTGNDTLDFTDDTGTYAARVAAGWYKTPQELATALQTAIDDLTAETVTVVYSNTTGKFTIASSTSTVLELLWNTGTNTARTIGTALGFAVAADDTAAVTYTSDNAQTYAAPFTPSFDAADPISAKGHIVYFGDATDNVCFGPSTVDVTITNERKTIDNICAASGRSGSVITGRTITVSVSGLMNQYDADKIDRLLQNKDSRFQYIGGLKSGGNWVPGKNFGIYLPYCSVDSFTVGDDESLTTVEFEISAFVPNDGSLEVFMGFV
jgi:hypothetical protein